MSTDTLLVQLVSSGLLACGLLAVFSATALFPARVSIGEVTRRNPIPWSPRALGGKGSAGRSPVFGAMWGLIFLSIFVFLIAIFAYALMQQEVQEPATLFNQCGCVTGALLMASVWTPLFTAAQNWTFVVASILLVVTAMMTGLGAILAKPFFSQEWWMIFGGISTTFFAGWALVAAGLSIGIVTKVYNHGIDAAERKEPTSSFFPLVLSVVTAVIAIVFANPIYPVPLLLTLPFVPGIFKDWRVWVPAIICVVGIGGGTAMVFVYRGSGYPF